MKPVKITVTREGKKRFSVEKPYDGVSPGYGYHGDGSYVSMSMEETLAEALQAILYCFDLNNEFEVKVTQKIGSPSRLG